MVEENVRIKNEKYRRGKKWFYWNDNQNELMSKKHKKICASLNFIEHFLILASLISGCVSISVFASLLGCHMRITW